jgi:hypothetical protein
MSYQPLDDDEFPSLINRLATAVLAPVFFNLSLLIVWAMFFRRVHFYSGALTHRIPLSGTALLWLSIGLPALAGFILGAGRSITLLGHFFYTNRGFERNRLITIALWIGLLFCAYQLEAVVSL